MNTPTELTARSSTAYSPTPGELPRLLRRTRLGLLAWSHARADRRAARGERLGILDPDAPQAVRSALTEMFRR